MKVLKIKITKDGDSWCALIGKDLQDGTGGFGETPVKAVKNVMDAVVTDELISDRDLEEFIEEEN